VCPQRSLPLFAGGITRLSANQNLGPFLAQTLDKRPFFAIIAKMHKEYQLTCKCGKNCYVPVTLAGLTTPCPACKKSLSVPLLSELRKHPIREVGIEKAKWGQFDIVAVVAMVVAALSLAGMVLLFWYIPPHPGNNTTAEGLQTKIERMHPSQLMYEVNEIKKMGVDGMAPPDALREAYDDAMRHWKFQFGIACFLLAASLCTVLLAVLKGIRERRKVKQDE